MNMMRKEITIEAACGQCQFDMEGDGCDLAVRIDGKVYFVDGTHIDAHGDAHDDKGFCNAISLVKTKGKIINGRYKVESFVLTG